MSIGGLLKNGAFVGGFCSFVGVFSVLACAFVRKMSKKRGKTKKNEEKRGKVTRNLQCIADFRRFLTRILIG
jgi:hypothetical protein